MNILYKFNKLTINLENKILLKNLYIKFFIRNKLDKVTFIVENEFFFFNIDYFLLKKSIQSREKKSIFSCTNDKNYLENNQLIGFSVLIKETLIKHKNYKNLQIYFFLKKRIFINILKFQFLFFKIFFKILEMKIPLVGSIVKVIKGGYICEINLLTIQAYLSDYCFQNQEEKSQSINNYNFFYNLTKKNNPTENISLFYSFCFLKNVDLNLTLIWNSAFFFTNKFIFPLYFFVIIKLLNKESKSRIKSLFKFKKKKKYSKLKKKKIFMIKRKFRFKNFRIFLSTQNIFKKKKVFIDKEIILAELEEKCKILIEKIMTKSV